MLYVECVIYNNDAIVLNIQLQGLLINKVVYFFYNRMWKIVMSWHHTEVGADAYWNVCSFWATWLNKLLIKRDSLSKNCVHIRHN